jgi:hypothetical protein
VSFPPATLAPSRSVLGEELLAPATRGTASGSSSRRAPPGRNLFFGRNEDCGLRCGYHGWKFDVDGRCVEIPTMARDRGSGHASG